MTAPNATVDHVAADHIKDRVPMMNHVDVLLCIISWGGKISVHDRLGGRVMLRDPAGGRVPAHDWLE